jgi:hypothetical protein
MALGAAEGTGRRFGTEEGIVATRCEGNQQRRGNRGGNIRAKVDERVPKVSAETKLLQ